MPRDLLKDKPRKPRDLLEGKGELKPVENSIGARVGNWLYDTANAVGLPASRMRRDLQGADDFVRGAADVATFGTADELAALGTSATSDISYDQALNAERLRDANAGPMRTAGQVAGGLATGALMAPISPSVRMAQGGRGLLPVSAASGAEGATLGAGYAYGSGEGIEDRANLAKTGLVTGGVIGAATPAVVTGATKLGQKIVSPNPISPERKAMADILRREGVQTTAGQQSGSKSLRYKESAIGGSKAADIFEKQYEQFTAATLSRAGITANRATPEVIDQGFRDIGRMFDDLSARNTLRVDKPLVSDLRKARANYRLRTGKADVVPLIDAKLKGIADDISSGTLTGEKYQSIRSTLGEEARNATKPEVRRALYDIQNALDDAMERNIRLYNPSDAGAWTEARQLYRNMLVIQDAATRAGETSALGLITPSQLRSAATRQNKSGYARGKGDFADLARAGEALMRPMPNSGTADRLGASLATAGIRGGVGAALGESIGQFVGLPGGGYAGGLAGIALPAIQGRAMMSGPGQKYLTNQLLPPIGPGGNALINSMLRNSAIPQVP
ncbi:MAG: hypothetical protein MnENMB40S_28860 [Rhizobiaceae bacterium MnEN-MB40S]|nr:MAG: hypothetical protein MnENMB40S_28860 [Rhizobiaceae bacterium MnEN-MB40S]